MTAREVELSGGAPWGFRMHGGVDHNQPLRISRVNPGRKASLCGIREGDVISSINGRPARTMSNADAHAMLRSAGPVLRLGLNEDREGSPRRRSIGKGSDLKRPSQPIAEFQSGRATPQAPVYATIRPSQSPQHRPNSSMRSSLNSIPTALNSTPLVRSVTADEQPRFHPTNPFYTTLPSNCSNASKLPIPNGRASLSTLDRKPQETPFNEYGGDLKSPSFFTKTLDSGPSSLPYSHNAERTNGHDSVAKSTDSTEYFRTFDQYNNQSLPNDKIKNPFDAKRNSDPFEKYLRPDNKMNGTEFDIKSIPSSMSDSNFRSSKETKSTTITEHKISETEEVKTIKKVILNGCEGSGDDISLKSPMNGKAGLSSQKQYCSTQQSGKERILPAPILQQNEPFSATFDQKGTDERSFISNTSHRPTVVGYKRFNSAEASPSEVVIEKPPVTPTPGVQSPTAKPVWRPGAPTPPPAPADRSPGAPLPSERSAGAPPPPPPPPVWSPGSAASSPLAPRKPYRPVHFEDTTPPPRRKFGNSEQNGCTSGSESESRLRTSQSAPATGLHSLGGSTTSGRLPRAQNPTVTLLQKAREGQIPRGTNYLQQEKDSARLPRDRPSPPRGDPVHALRREYASETEGERSDHERGASARKMADAPNKIEGIGPITRDGMPVSLRSEVKDPSKWYKKMYDTIHKNKYDGQPPERVQSNRSQYAYFDPRSGYLSEPEGGPGRPGPAWGDAYDSDVTAGPRRRTASVQEERRNEPYTPSNKYSTLASARASQEMYKTPGRIENYVPGRSSVVDKEAKQWWDEVMDIFDGQNISSTTSLPQPSPKEKKDITSAILSKSNMARALKESGYESDSTLVFRRREEADGPLSPAERHRAYRDLQAGADPPLRGFRSPAPPRQDESEIEYIPISPTLTKIRVHKKTPLLHEVICYPVTGIETDANIKFRKQAPSFINPEPEKFEEFPPAPPRRISSKNSRTLRLVTSTRPVSTSPKRSTGPKITAVSKSNVDFLKDKISHKLQRQNTHIISKTSTATEKAKIRMMSTSAPPAVNRKNIAIPQKHSPKSDSKITGFTSSFGSSRRTLLPTEYAHPPHSKYGNNQSVAIEGGAGRRTPISNILDKVTTLDKLWSAEKRNERIDLLKAKSISKSAHNIAAKVNAPKTTSSLKPLVQSATHRSRDMVRTAEKVQKLKVSNSHTKSNPCLVAKSDQKSIKSNTLQSSTNMSKSSSNIASTLNKKQNQVRTATVTNLKKKKSLENVVMRPRSVPCHESCSKKSKETTKSRKPSKVKSSKRTTSRTSNDSESGSQFGDSNVSNYGSFENLDGKRISSKDIKRSHDAVVSDSFFQHLFLGKSYLPSPTISYASQELNTSVLQKAHMFQTLPQDSSMPKSLNSYLVHRKPVSLSRFKLWDRYPSPTSVQSPRSISWPGRMQGEIRKFDSLSKWEEFGSTSSLATIRSRSEPPCNKIFFSQTTRPKSPTIVFYKKEKSKESSPARSSVSPSRMYFSQTSRPVSPKVIRKVDKPVPLIKKQSLSPSRIIFTETIRPISPTVERRQPRQDKIHDTKTDAEKNLSTLFFSQTSRPVSPKVIKKSLSTASLSRSQSTSPVSIRSPSYRRIHNVRIQSNKNDLRSAYRTRSAGDAEKTSPQSISRHKTQSESSLLADDPEYDEYILDMQNMKVRSDRFRELNRYYTYLERVGELEKATSTRDLRHRRKDEEIIDFERWKKIRSIERAEEELNNLYKKLKVAQTESDVLFYPRDVKDFRWNYDTDRGLRIKEKSVEDLKDHFQQISHYDSLEFEHPTSKDTYKPLWRGTSVAETAFHINKKNTKYPGDRSVTKQTVTRQQDTTFSELRKKIGLGSRLWSSLSMEQVHALKNQLNAIYSKELESKSNKDFDKYTIDVSDINSEEKPKLQVRCNSLSNYIPEKENIIKLSKSDSIASIPCPITSVKDLKNNVNKIQMTLSENEKRKISQTLSKELLDRINKYDSPTPMSLKQELEMSQEKENTDIEKFDVPISNKSSEEPASFQNSDSEKYLAPSSEKTEIHCQSSASETETASSGNSNKTVVYKGPSQEVQMKVKYFESVTTRPEKTKTVYHARDNSDEKDKAGKIVCDLVPTKKRDSESQRSQISQSQSCANFKELFGESEKNKFLSLPSKPELRSRSGSPHSEANVVDRRTPDTLRSSDETIWRSRSPSPDPERYWRAYLNLARAGEVRRLARRFDSPTAAGAVLRRHRSDPEIARNVLNRNWSAYERFSSRSDRCKVSLPVARVPLRTANRYMPHIDIISKLASLRRRTAPRSRSAEEAFQCRSGEVDRIRRRFETMSVLGQIYASAPDVSELRDMAPYLAGSWIAHRYPKRSDNNRSVEDPSTLVRGRISPVRKEIKRPKESVKLSSILKSDVFEKREFDPSLHRPVHRYEPPRTPPRPPPAAWPSRVAPLVTPSRHTVTFQETDSAPEPPRRTSHGSYSDTESPRRYVESDVNIHYRCPVRHDPLPLVPERELARQQAEHMKRLYREQRRIKYLQELQDMQNRRHQDNFTPSQKNILPLNRYDEADKVVARALYTFNGQTNRELSFRKGETIHVRRQIDANWYEGEIHGRVGLFPYNYVEELQDMQNRRHQDNFTPSQKNILPLNRYDEADKVVARALYTFNGQTNRELSFRKGETIHVRRQIDANWYEGEIHGRVGLFPYNYVEIQKGDNPQPQKKPIAVEGRARAKFEFTAQTNLELPLKKGEVVVLTRRIDQNWWEGRNGTKTGIFPDSYVTILQEPSQNKPEPQLITSSVDKPAASPAAHGLVNGTAKRSMGAHSYTPQQNSAALSNAPPATQPLPGYTSKSQGLLTPSERGYGPPTGQGVDLNNSEPLYVDTNAEAIPYRAMYKYRPQNPDELELSEGDTVYVLEQCDDGWYVGSSQRTGRFGTFPGNYVERI